MAEEKGISRAALMIVITAGIASLLEIVDTSIVNVAIPTMMGNLGATLDDIGWVVTGYIISNAIVLPISGWLGTRFGRRRYYMTCITLFVISSVACGLSPNLDTLIFLPYCSRRGGRRFTAHFPGFDPGSLSGPGRFGQRSLWDGSYYRPHGRSAFGRLFDRSLRLAFHF